MSDIFVDFSDEMLQLLVGIEDSRVLKISKDDLMLLEQQLLWTPDLEKEVVGYWKTLNGYWNSRSIPACTCANYEINTKTGKGFMADEKYNDYFWQGEPCSLEWMKKTLSEGLWKMPEKEK